MAKQKLGVTTLTVLSGQTVSSASFEFGDNVLLAIQTPAAVDGTQLTFQASADGVTFDTMIDSGGSTVTVTMAASRYVLLEPYRFAGIVSAKLVMVTTATADRIYKLIYRHI